VGEFVSEFEGWREEGEEREGRREFALHDCNEGEISGIASWATA
jgi:hypothetical protein